MSRIEADVAIVGGGLIGCAAAYYLRRRGRSVVVLERDIVGGQSSGVSFGNLRLQGQHETELPLAMRAQRLWEGLEAELGESLEFVQHGHVHVALAAEHIGRMERHRVQGQRHGLAIELLDGAETRRHWPFLSDKVLAASWSPRDAVVNPRSVAPAFARAAMKLGAIIHEHVGDVVVEHGNGRFTLRGTVAGDAGPVVAAACVINAAGAWSGALAARFGEALPIFPAGPVEIITEPVPRFVRPVIHAIDGSILFRQTMRGNILIGGHPRIPVDARNRRARVPPDKMTTNMARLVALVPHMRAHHAIRCWTGIEGYLPDMMPVIGPSETTPGFFHACAFSGHGLQLGPAAAVALAELIVDGRTNMPIEPYAIGRFQGQDGSGRHDMAEEFVPEITGHQNA